MPRKRTISDEALLDAALVLVRANGPDSLTFAALAAASGLAAPTIVQRFGTKAALLRAAMSSAWDKLDAATADADEAAPMGATGVVELLVALSGQYDPDDYADQLLLLREDLRDPTLRARGEAWMQTLIVAIERRLVRRPRDLDRVTGLGRLVIAQWQGTLTVWSFLRHAPLKDAVKTSLEDLFRRLRINVEP
jgi:AcrR family transcriptional regulator